MVMKQSFDKSITLMAQSQSHTCISGDETTISAMETIEYHGNHHDNTHHKAIVTLVMKQSCDMASIVMSHSQVSGDCATDWRAMLECKTLEESEKGRRVILF